MGGNCETGDRDVITLNAGGDDPNRVICGELTGQHAYMDVSPANTNAATITIATHTNAASGGTKNWRIKVSQIECDSEYRAPQGCLQYFFENVKTIEFVSNRIQECALLNILSLKWEMD